MDQIQKETYCWRLEEVLDQYDSPETDGLCLRFGREFGEKELAGRRIKKECAGIYANS